jgi:hypothetical protein
VPVSPSAWHTENISLFWQVAILIENQSFASKKRGQLIVLGTEGRGKILQMIIQALFSFAF